MSDANLKLAREGVAAWNRGEAEEFREVGDRVVILGRVHAKGRGSGVELDQPVAMACWFRDGKFSRTVSFLDHDAAIEAASQEAVS